jgi:hypothetical protein
MKESTKKALDVFLASCLTAALLLMMIFGFFGCGVKKHVTKSETKEETKENIHAVETTTTTNTYTGSILLQADSISNLIPIDNLLSGDTATSEDSEFIITTHFDKRTKTVKTKTIQKPKKVPISGTITAVKQATISTKKEGSKVVREKQKDVKRFNILPFIIPFCILLFILLALWALKKMNFK